MKKRKKRKTYGRYTAPGVVLAQEGVSEAELVESVHLPIPAEQMSLYFEGVKACSLMAIFNIHSYYTKKRSLELAQDLRRYAKRWFYFDWRGTPIITIAKIIKGWGKRQGLYYRTRHSVVLSWQEMTRHIRQGQPFILNIARGDYKKHSVTVVGFERFMTSQGERRFLQVADSWADGPRYIDYDRMTWGRAMSLASVVYPRLEGYEEKKDSPY